MTALQQFASPKIAGLEIVINTYTGEVYASQRALARLIDKHNEYVRRYEFALLEGDTEIDKIEAEIQTPSGVQGATLYGENFIFSLLAKYKPNLLVEAAKAGMRLYFYGIAGYSPEETVRLAGQALTSWEETREQLKFGHCDFVNAYKAKSHPGSQVHDLITKTITGFTASEARKELSLVGDDSSIGLDYQPSPDQLAVIAKAKKLYSRYRKGTWQEQAIRAAHEAMEEWNQYQLTK